MAAVSGRRETKNGVSRCTSSCRCSRTPGTNPRKPTLAKNRNPMNTPGAMPPALSSAVRAVDLTFRRAARDDLNDIVRLLADDPLGAKRESYGVPLPDSYLEAFAAIDRDPNNELVVAELGGAVIGVLQLTFIP